jgi:hypothetical protein
MSATTEVRVQLGNRIDFTESSRRQNSSGGSTQSQSPSRSFVVDRADVDSQLG